MAHLGPTPDSRAMPWWGWVVISVMLLGSELIITTDFFLALLGASALSVALIAGIGLEIAWAQWALFAGLSVLYLMVFGRRIAGWLGAAEPEGEFLEGEAAVLQEDIEPGETGAAELRGSRWTALNKGRTLLATGARVRVERAEGLTVHVRSEADFRARRKHRNKG